MRKPIIFLLHGALGTKTQFSKLEKELSQNFDIHSFDFEGHGDNLSNNEFSIELFTKNLSDYFIQNKIQNASIFGYSMGGYVALNFAKNHPEKLNKIFTFGTKFDWTPESTLKETSRLEPTKIQEKIPQFAAHLEKIHVSNDWKSVLEKTAKMMTDLGNGKLLKKSDFQQISTPVLIGIGTKDTMVNSEESKFAASHIQHAQLFQFIDFVHPLEQNDMKILSKSIIDFCM